ncbi:putative p21-activated kinase 3 [Trypanosoma conorhini]|uniref:Putative p21-activated kinase 3 n=1 Tax=Trypanosoma conorhini TaxID=83891 RepID=A0A422PZG9_9TRYP|nr:putative p21-activated kinase 3 [Trypanosoma conorhini]RNF23151.1 putative p21-activated kinase 3 [Trypanosoma conorhini]
MSTFLSPESLDILVSDPKWQNGHIEYKICIRKVTDTDGFISATYRRFSEIYLVFKRLLQLDPDAHLPNLPQKKMIGATDPVFVERRRRELETFFKAVCKNKLLVGDIALLSLVGFSDAKAALAQRSEKETVVTSDSVGCILTWILGDLPTLDTENSILATRQFLRSTKYTLSCILPPLSFGPPRRFYALVKDGKDPYLLSVIPLHPERGLHLNNNKLAARLCGFLLRPLLPSVFTPVEAHADGIRAYLIRKVVKGGSIRDRAYNADWSTESGQKFRGKGKAFSVGYIARVVEAALLMVKAFHSSQMSCPFLSLGKCFDDSNQILFSGVEDIFLGITRYPAVLPPTEHTHVDVLLVGALALEMALGSPLAKQKELGLITAYNDPTEALETDRKSRLKLVNELLETLPSSVPQELVSFLKATFDPTCRVETDVLLQHPFITQRRARTLWMRLGKTKGTPSSVQLKRKEVDMFCEVAGKWHNAVKMASIRFSYEKQSRFLLREIRRKKSNGYHSSASGSYASDDNTPRRTVTSEEVAVEKGEAMEARKTALQPPPGIPAPSAGVTRPSEGPQRSALRAHLPPLPPPPVPLPPPPPPKRVDFVS